MLVFSYKYEFGLNNLKYIKYQLKYFNYFLNLIILNNNHVFFSLQGSSNSYAIKKKDELERVAKSNR